MADEERKILIDVELDTKDFNKEIANVNEELEENRKQIRELKKDYSENSEEIARLELQNRKLSDSKRQLIKESQTEANSLNALRLRLANLTKERNNLDTSIEGNAERFAQLQEEIKATSDEIKNFEQEGGDFRRNVGNYGKAVDLFGTALKGLGIAAVVGLLARLGQKFLENQRIADTLSVAINAVNRVLDDLVTFAVNNVDSLTNVFSRPLPSVEELGESIKTGITSRFKELLETVGFINRAFERFFRGDFSGALEDITQAGEEFADIFTGRDGTVQALRDGVQAAQDYAAEVIRTARAQTELNNAARLAEVQQQRVIQQLERQAEIQRQIRDDESRGFTERIKANETLGKILEQQAQSELGLIESRLELARLNVEQNNNIENQIALQEALLAQEDVLNRIEGQRSEQLVNRIALEKERQEQLEEFRKAERDFANEQLKLDEERAQRDKELAEERAQTLISAQTSITNSVINLVGQQTAAGKALAIGQIIADSARGVSAAIAAGAGIPFPGNLAAIATGVASVLSGIAQAKALLSQDTGGLGGALGIAGISGSAGQQPAIIQPALLDQFSQPVQQQQELVSAAGNQPVIQSQVSVVDIKKGLNQNAVKVNESSL